MMNSEKQSIIVLAVALMAGLILGFVWRSTVSHATTPLPLENKLAIPRAIINSPAAWVEMEMLLSEAAKINMDIGARVIREHVPNDYRAYAQSILCEAVGYYHEKKGAQWFTDNLPPDKISKHLLNRIFEGWFFANPQEFYTNINDSKNKGMPIDAKTLEPLAVEFERTHGRDEIKSWPALFPNEVLRKDAYAVALNRAYSQDKFAACSWFVEKSDLNQSPELRVMLAKRIASDAPEQGLAWFGQNTAWKSMQSDILKNWAPSDTWKAERWLLGQVADNKANDDLISAFISGCGAVDWKLAEAWVMEIEDASKRSDALLGLALTLHKIRPFEAAQLVGGEMFSDDLRKRYYDAAGQN